MLRLASKAFIQVCWFLFRPWCQLQNISSTLIKAVRMFLAERFSLFCIKSFAFQIYLACRAVKTLWVPVLIQSLDPTIAWFNGELATSTFSLEHGLPVFLTICLAIFHMKLSTSNRFATVEAKETLWVKGVLECIDAFPQNSRAALSASWSKVFLIVLLAK